MLLTEAKNTFKIVAYKLYLFGKWVAKNPKVIYSALLFYGALCAYFIISGTSDVRTNIPEAEAAYHYRWLGYVIDYINGGSIAPHKAHGPSLYFLLAYIGKLFNISSPQILAYGIQFAFGGSVLMFYPVMMFRLTKSLMAAILSPFIIHSLIGDMLYISMRANYWALSWVIVMGVPIVAILFSGKQNKESWLWYIAVCLVIAAGNAVRGDASLPLVLLVFVYIFTKIFKRTKLSDGFISALKCNISFFAALIALLMSQSFFSATVPAVVFPGFSEYKAEVTNKGLPWHILYIGLGWEENKYGIEFRDGYARELAEAINPDVIYLSEEYEDILAEEYIKILKSDPGFIIGTYLRKFAVATFRTTNRYLNIIPVSFLSAGRHIALIFAAFCVYINAKSKRMNLSLLLCSIFCMFSAMITPLLSIPLYFYMYGTYTAGGLVMLSLYISVIVFFTSSAKNELKQFCSVQRMGDGNDTV